MAQIKIPPYKIRTVSGRWVCMRGDEVISRHNTLAEAAWFVYNHGILTAKTDDLDSLLRFAPIWMNSVNKALRKTKIRLERRPESKHFLSGLMDELKHSRWQIKQEHSDKKSKRVGKQITREQHVRRTQEG